MVAVIKKTGDQGNWGRAWHREGFYFAEEASASAGVDYVAISEKAIIIAR
jgi:hypothetical protein